MMKQLFKSAKSASIVLFAIFVLGCEKKEELPKVTSSFTQTVNNTTGAVTFKNTSTNATIYLWDLGDGTNSTQFEPTKTYQTGSYTVKLTATNTSGGTATSQNTFTVTLPVAVDTTKPIITLVGDATINLTVGDPYVDKGATANDNLDGIITSKIVKGGTVNTATPGTYTITYDVTDLAGNAATRVTRSVIVTAFDDGLLNNGAFSILKGQAGDAWSGNGFNVINEGGTNFNFVNVATAGQPFDVNLSQVLPLVQGNNYILTFEASSGVARTMIAGIGLNFGSFAADVKTVDLTTTKKTFTLNLSAAAIGGANNRVLFDMGAAVGTVVIDNVKLVEGPPTPKPTPTTSAPTPPARAAADVISIYGEAYTNLSGINYNPDWGQSGKASVNTAFNPGNGNLVLAYPNFNYQGTELPGNQDASAMNFLHVDIWVAPGTDRLVKVSPINNGGVGEVLTVVPLTPGAWNSVDLPKSSFTGMTWNAVFQMKFDGQFNGNGSANTAPFDIYLDNIYFYKAASGGGGTGTELTTNGNFETGTKTGWTEFPNGGATFTVSNAEANGGTFSGKLTASEAQDVVIKQANLSAGTITNGQSVTIKFDLKGTLAGAGGVVFAEFFSELSAGGTSKAEILSGGPLFPTSTWTTYTYTTTTASVAQGNVGGGVTLQLKAACGAVSGCNVVAYIDNVSVKINP
jgi:hypothetical protein